jgi:hypothetical protein
MDSQRNKSKNNQVTRSKNSKKHNRKPKIKTEDNRPVLEVKSIERDPMGYDSYKNQGLEKIISCMKSYKASLLKETSVRDKAREFSLLFNLISPAYIQMKYECTVLDPNAEKTDKTESKEEQTGKAEDKSLLKSYNDEFPDCDDEDVLQTPDYSFMNDPNVVIGRVLLTRIRNKSHFNYPLSFQCNGVIIDSDTWDVLSVPPPAFNPNVKYSAVAANLQNYKIYSILDGTTVTLYWYKKTSSWCFSTINGYDMGNMKWMGDKTYAQLFDEVVSNYKGFSFDALEKDVCYSIGFRHPSMHPLITDPISAWLIKATKLNTVNCQIAEDKLETSAPEPMKSIGIPVQMPISIETLGFVPTSTGYSDANGNAVDNRQIFQRLLDINGMALEHYLYSVSNKLPASIHYGFILRGDFVTCRDYSHVMIESQLLKFIRLSIYNTPKVKANNLKITPENRIKYCVLRAYLNFSQREVFIKIFPMYVKLYNVFNEIIESTVNKIWIICRKPNAKTNTAANTANSKSQMIDAMATTFHNIIMKSENINVYDPNFKSIIRDYIERSCFTDLYYNMIYNSNF